MSDNLRKSLRDRAKEFSSNLPFMDGREKGDVKDLAGLQCTIREYGFLTNDKGDTYSVFTIDQDTKKFYFGGMVLTDQLQQLEEEGYRDAILEEGLPARFTLRKAKKGGKEYMNVVFFPEDEAEDPVVPM